MGKGCWVLLLCMVFFMMSSTGVLSRSREAITLFRMALGSSSDVAACMSIAGVAEAPLVLQAEFLNCSGW